MPTELSNWTAARLLDVRSAVRSVIELAFECSSSGSQPPCGVSIGSFRCVITEPGENPASSAAAYTNGLNAEPDCRFACTARLNELSLKSRPPTMARTWPVAGSIATSAACRYWGRSPLTAGCAPRTA
jgi:hypothetical protein